MTSLRLTREDLRVIYTPGRGVTVYRRIALMGPPRWTRVAWFLAPERAEEYLGWADWPTILADFEEYLGWADWPTILADFTARRAERAES